MSKNPFALSEIRWACPRTGISYSVPMLTFGQLLDAQERVAELAECPPNSAELRAVVMALLKALGFGDPKSILYALTIGEIQELMAHVIGESQKGNPTKAAEIPAPARKKR